MAGEIKRLIDIAMERKRIKAEADKANRLNPSAALADSLAVSKERFYQGYPLARADSLRLRDAGVEGFQAEKESKLTDYGLALARIREGTGDRADSVHVGLQPRAAIPRTPSYSTREAIDPQTGKKIFAQTNSLTGEIKPARTTLAPASREEKGEDPEKEYLGALRRSNDIQGEIARIDNVLNDPNLKDGAEIDDRFGGKKYVDRAALQKERDGLVKEQKIHLRKTATAELAQTMPAADFKGRTVTDKATGIKFRSDGEKWVEVK